MTHSSKDIKSLAIILRRHKLLTTTLVVVLFVLLIRIPLGTFNDASWIDSVGHIVLPGISALLIYAWLVECSYLPRLRPKTIVVCILLIGAGLEVSWEIIEFSIDQMFHWNWQLDNTDTMIDIISGVIGAFITGIVFVASDKTN